MFTVRQGRRLAVGIAATAVAALALSACSAGDPTAGETAASDTITVGSAGFPESEIIAQIYIQALEANDIKTAESLNIGARDVYIAALEDGSIDLVPDYSGNLLQFFDDSATATSSDEVYSALQEATPKGYEVLDQSKAEDKDSYNVTKEFSEANNVTSLADLAALTIPLAIGGAPELAERPYGPKGLTEVYGVPADKLTFVPISDGGGAQTTAALLDGTVQLADIYTTTPSITENDFVTLEDPENLILPQNVLPLINSAKASDKVKEVLNAVSAELTTEDLIELNARNQGDEKAAPKTLAADWLKDKKLFS
ncbi:ABC transporter substrate-binding protein [Plantibacter sp. PA-3-X8]|jgi:osmoprotectant transport system substrate-binding protein|uniref:Osmoprotectant transport system substrate-binding protein n=3 Tax=Plantibacter TaxID=190323 RepID=A0A3N2C1L5_9MICO|nr:MULTISPECIES: ABC transporter substrate-binding protein [Plantibacter]AZH83278.1 ABC transporter substrate-binding protein [Plantibacter sp. PA-3-X8]MBD8102302.1 ABC transporter substrate-binding protein [Plantibacter sp. CFBP 8775]MBD8467001.1 ABC transporter substrate-binding protein [Plantibacter sp. CFBP 8798]MBD8516188.1 ABC transporter substrate-binding protein [Plantibacter sp. CFBP 8804]MDD9152404.1 ABC transporter substrate-binding protein [Plantibacter flavus]